MSEWNSEKSQNEHNDGQKDGANSSAFGEVFHDCFGSLITGESYNKGFDNGRCHKPDSEFRDNDRSNHSYESSEMHSNSAHTEHHSSDNLQWLSVSAALVLLIFALDCGRHLGEQEFNPLSSRNITYTEAPMYLERSEASTQKSKRDFAADQRQQELERKWLESMSVNDRTSQLAKQSSSPSAQSSETAKPEFTWNSQPSTSGAYLYKFTNSTGDEIRLLLKWSGDLRDRIAIQPDQSISIWGPTDDLGVRYYSGASTSEKTGFFSPSPIMQGNSAKLHYEFSRESHGDIMIFSSEK